MSIRLSIAETTSWAATVADVVQRQLERLPDAVLSFPTGRTPLPLYAELRRRGAAGELNTAGLRAVMLDDYLDGGDAAFSFRHWLRRELFDPLGVGRERVLQMPAQSADVEADCVRFEQTLAMWGGCELQLLGLGANGHIGFNEPGAEPDARTHPVTLTPETAHANAAYWDGAFLPHRAVTMGIGTILEARHIVLLVRGGRKAGILRRVLQEPPTRELPASFLQRAADVLVVADTEAAVELSPNR